MKLKQIMFMKIFMKIRVCLILVVQDSKFFDPVNNKVIGKVKDGIKEKIISKFFGLKSKMYSLVIANNEEINKSKGVNENVVKSIRHREYIDILFKTLELMMLLKFLCLVLMIKG